MNTHSQMQLAIDAATAKVAAKGYDTDEVTTKDVLLAGLGHVAHVVDQRFVLIRIEGRKSFWAGVVLGIIGIAIGAIGLGVL